MSTFAVSLAAETLRDVEYSRPDGVSLRFDASIPHGAGPFPAVIVVHGGAWVSGDRRWNVQPVFQPLTEAGFAWFSISYRLVRDAMQIGAGVVDVTEALRFIRAHAAEYRIDPRRIALAGESAGGQLAAMAALRASPPVQAVVALYTPTDLVALAKNSTLIPSEFRERLRGSPFESIMMAALAQLSPVEQVRPGMPPFLLIHGTADTLVPFEQSRIMCDRMTAVGASCELFPVTGGGHGMRWWESQPGLAQPWKRAMVDWLRNRLLPSTT